MSSPSPVAVSQGETRDEALANIREAISACLEVRAERGMPLTVETQQVESFSLMPSLPHSAGAMSSRHLAGLAGKWSVNAAAT